MSFKYLRVNNHGNSINSVQEYDIDNNVNMESENDIYEQVFSLNQLLFPILLYIGFPACLCLSAVTQSWRARIWPNQVLTHQQWIGKMSRYRGKRKCLDWKTVKDAVPMKTQSLVSSNASFGSYVRKATFTRFPRTKCRLRNILHQLFVTYPKLQEITIDPRRDTASNFDISTFKIFLEYWNRHWVANRKLNLLNTCVYDLSRKTLEFSDIVVYIENDQIQKYFGFKFTMENLHLHFTCGEFMNLYKLANFFDKVTDNNNVKIFEITFGSLTFYDQTIGPTNIVLFRNFISSISPLKRLKISVNVVNDYTSTIPLTVNCKPATFPNLESVELSDPFVRV